MTNLTQLIEEKEKEFDIRFKNNPVFRISPQYRKKLKNYIRTAMLETALTMESSCKIKEEKGAVMNGDLFIQSGFNRCLSEKSRLEKKFINGNK